MRLNSKQLRRHFDMRHYFAQHLRALSSTLKEMRTITSLNTMLIVAIMLLLPCLFYVFLKSAQALSGNWQGRPQMTIFLQQQLHPNVSELIYQELRLMPTIEQADLITPEQALAEYKGLVALDDTGEQPSLIDTQLELLGSNPLPASIVILPNLNSDLRALKQQLSEFEGIESIKLDLEWVERFNAIIHLIRQVVLLISVLLAIALIIIVGNIIRLLIMNRSQEIEIIKLVGGSDAFVRRPFLYYGTLLGLFGALIALALLWFAGDFTQTAIDQLAVSYQTDNLIYSLNIQEIASILALGSVLGWVAARWSVARHLKHIQPH